MGVFFQSQQIKIDFNQNRTWFLTWGIVITLLGLVAICLSAFTTMATVIFLGALFLAGGIVNLIDTFQFWKGKSNGFYMHFISAILYLILGGLLIVSPVMGAISLTMLMSIFFVIIGLSRIFFSISLRLPHWGWTLFSGLVTLLLGILIIAQLPISGLYVIGLFVGIDLFFWGWTYIMIALFSKSKAAHA